MTLDDLFGTPLSVYTDDDAVRDGILIPFLEHRRDTRHRMTTNAWEELTAYHKAHGSLAYTDKEFYHFFFAELLPLVPSAHHGWNHGDILKTDYTFKPNGKRGGILWYLPNERGGITIMLPEDY